MNRLMTSKHPRDLGSAPFRTSGDAESIMSQFELHLESLLPGAEVVPRRLHEAMRHAMLGGGKRLRPQLMLLVAEACSREPWSPAVTRLLTLSSCAVEMIHTASLIHDDLPTFDDSPIRRGKPTVHVAYGEPTAILAGDALIALAFEVLSTAPFELSDRIVRIMNSMAVSVSSAQGLTGGQSLEADVVSSSSRAITQRRRRRGSHASESDLLERCYAMKTGALFRAAAEAGACAVGATDTTAWTAMGDCIGLAFQYADDLCDVFSEPDLMQKPVGRDSELGRPNAVLAYGSAEVRRRLADSLDKSRFLVTSSALAPAKLLAWIDHLNTLLTQLTAPRP